MNAKSFRFWSSKVTRAVICVVFCFFVCVLGYAAQLPVIPQEDHSCWAVYGSLVTTEGAKEGWLVFDRGGISAVNCPPEKIPEGAHIIKYDGYIFPGLIDTHNHAQWNAIPQWRAGRTFQNRYEWQRDREYRDKVARLFYENLKGVEYASLKYAEIRGLIGGTTLIQSTYACPGQQMLIRELDATYGADSYIPDINKIQQLELNRFRTGFAAGKTRRIFLHIAEGKAEDPQSKMEFAKLEADGLVRPGVVVIHGIALTRRDFRKMAKASMFLVWSPKSNEVLYGETAKIQEALEEGVTVALAPDWTISGSDNVLEELKVAYSYSQNCLKGKISPLQLFKMTTSDAAKVAGVEERLGRLDFGYAADFFMTPRLDPDPYKSLLKTCPRHIHLVFVDGMPIYGDPEELRKWISSDLLDTIKVENVNKSILLMGDLRPAWHSWQRYKDLRLILQDALKPVKPAPLIEAK